MTLSLAIADAYGSGRDVARIFEPGILEGIPSPAAIAFLIFRVAAMFLSMAVLAGAGLLEILLRSHALPMRARTAPAARPSVELADALNRISN